MSMKSFKAGQYRPSSTYKKPHEYKPNTFWVNVNREGHCVEHYKGDFDEYNRHRYYKLYNRTTGYTYEEYFYYINPIGFNNLDARVAYCYSSDSLNEVVKFFKDGETTPYMIRTTSSVTGNVFDENGNRVGCRLFVPNVRAIRDKLRDNHNNQNS